MKTSAVAAPYRPPAVKPLAPPLRSPRYEDVPLATVPLADGTSLELRFDVYQHPEQTEPGPCVVYFFGGGWTDGDYKQRTAQKAVYVRDLVELTDRGLTVVSASYRLVQEAPFPACVHDAKGLIRHLKTHGAQYLIDPDRIGVIGNSAGGHLAGMVALSSGDARLEGDTGGNLDRSSDVRACVMYYAPTDLARFSTYGARDTRGSEVDHMQRADTSDMIASLLGYDAERHGGRTFAESRLLDPAPQDVDELVEIMREYSPLHHVRADAPPVLVLHGGADALVPMEQSRLFVDALTEVGADATLLTYSLGAHGPSLGPAVDAFAYEFLISRL